MDCRDVAPGSFLMQQVTPRGIKKRPPWIALRRQDSSFIYTQRTTSRVSTAVFTSSSIFSESFVSEF